MQSCLLLLGCCSCRSLLGGWDRDTTKVPAFTCVLNQPLLCSSLQAVSSGGLVSELGKDKAQRGGGRETTVPPHRVDAMSAPAADSCPRDSAAERIPLQQPHYSLSARKYFRSQQILDIFYSPGRFCGFTFCSGYQRPDFALIYSK